MKRHSRRPAKQLLFTWLDKKFQLSEGRATGLDIACGKMLLRPWFKTKTYIGVDLDAQRITEGTARYPEAIGIVSRIEDMDSALQGDFVACIQAIGFNKHFNTKNALQCIKTLVNATGDQGTLIFNFLPPSPECLKDVRELLRTSFYNVEELAYGAFNFSMPRIFTSMLCTAMIKIPFLRTLCTRKRFLFICNKKTQNP